MFPSGEGWPEQWEGNHNWMGQTGLQEPRGECLEKREWITGERLMRGGQKCLSSLKTRRWLVTWIP